MKPVSEVLTVLGQTHGRPPARPFGIRYEDRRYHMMAFGQTGTGKSTWLLNQAKQELDAGRGFCLLDPHGDLAKATLEHAGENCIYWNPADPNCPYGYNPLTYVSEEYRSLVASGLIDTLKKLWSDAWGPRMENLMRMAFITLLARPHSSMKDIMPLFLDKSFRYQALQHVTDPYVRAFWNQEFAKLKYTSVADGVAPIANKLGAFLANAVVRKKICEPEKPLRFRKIMDEGQILIINLAKGKLGADITNVLGGLVVSSMSAAAMSRENVPLIQRKGYGLYVDELANFCSASFADALSEIRKYGLYLCTCTQHASQLTSEQLDGLLGNIGTLVSFRVGAKDAPLLSKQFGADVPTPRDLVNLPNYHMFVKLMINGQQSKPFTARILPC